MLEYTNALEERDDKFNRQRDDIRPSVCVGAARVLGGCPARLIANDRRSPYHPRIPKESESA